MQRVAAFWRWFREEAWHLEQMHTDRGDEAQADLIEAIGRRLRRITEMDFEIGPDGDGRFFALAPRDHAGIDEARRIVEDAPSDLAGWRFRVGRPPRAVASLRIGGRPSGTDQWAYRLSAFDESRSFGVEVDCGRAPGTEAERLHAIRLAVALSIGDVANVALLDRAAPLDTPDVAGTRFEYLREHLAAIIHPSVRPYLELGDDEIGGGWEHYLCRIDDELASVFLDLGLRGRSPLADRGVLVVCRLKMNTPRDDGLSSRSEYESLVAVEDHVVKEVSNALGALYVGRITTQGRREFCFYAASGEDLGAVFASAFKPFAQYAYQADAHRDPAWAQYNNLLFPGARDRRRILNRRRVSDLRAKGAALSAPCRMVHWLSFTDVDDRSRAESAIAQRDFRTRHEPTLNAAIDRRFILAVERVDAADLASINQVTLDLHEIAESANGRYEGWRQPTPTRGT